MNAPSLRVVFAVGVTSCVTLAAAIHFAPIPAALHRPPVQSIALVDRDGTPLREARVEERFSRELAIGDVPQHVRNAVLAAEDKRFEHHRGIDWLATGRAITNRITRGHVTSGASTITQQLVKISERRPRTLRTKLIESAIALRLEQLWSKDQILSAYLNRVDFGNLNIGLAAAADYYFGKPVTDLSEAEAAFLAGLPRNPRRLNPHVAFEKAQKREQTVLRRMQENGWLDAARFESAWNEPLQLRAPHRLFRAPHFTGLVLQQLPTLSAATLSASGKVFSSSRAQRSAVEGSRDATLKLTSRDPSTSLGLASECQLRTTLDLPLNEKVERILQERLAQLRDHNVHDAAAVVIDNASGDVIALVGSADYFGAATGQVNGAWAKRSAGSTLKPFTYLLALERGATPATIVADVPTSFPSADGFYRPENYNRRSYGPVTYRTALASSLNIPAVKVLLAAGGPPVLHERLRAAGLTTLDRTADVYGLGLTLGNCEARLLELTNAYASLARLGEFRPWRLLADAPTFSRPYSRPELVWQIADMMSDNSARTLAFGINSALRFDFPVACKTGTSTDFRDNWTIGFTPEFSVGVWVGNFDGSPMHEVSGVTGAGPILHGIFEHLHEEKGTSWYRTPAEIVERTVHPFTGKLLTVNEARGVREKFVLDNLPAAESAGDYDELGRVRLGSEFHEWFASGENGVRDRAVLADAASELRILSPIAGSTYLIDPDIRSSARIPLRAAGGEKLMWSSDSLDCGNGTGGEFMVAAEGEHRIAVTDPVTGQRAEVMISIRSL